MKKIIFILIAFVLSHLAYSSQHDLIGYELIVNGQTNGAFNNYNVTLPIDTSLTIGIVTADPLPLINAPVPTWLGFADNTAQAQWIEDSITIYPIAGDPGPILQDHQFGPEWIYFDYPNPPYPRSWEAGL